MTKVKIEDCPSGWMEYTARQKAGDIPPYPDWECLILETLMDGTKPSDIVRVTFHEKGTPYQRGPRKGKRRVLKAKRDVYVTRNEVREAEAAWEKETGGCARCRGKKEVLHSWSRQDGIKRKVCPKCNGTGMYQSKGET
jgi:DnaJ-class molecular chaperone